MLEIGKYPFRTASAMRGRNSLLGRDGQRLAIDYGFQYPYMNPAVVERASGITAFQVHRVLNDTPEGEMESYEMKVLGREELIQVLQTYANEPEHLTWEERSKISIASNLSRQWRRARAQQLLSLLDKEPFKEVERWVFSGPANLSLSPLKQITLPFEAKEFLRDPTPMFHRRGEAAQGVKNITDQSGLAHASFTYYADYSDPTKRPLAFSRSPHNFIHSGFWGHHLAFRDEMESGCLVIGTPEQKGTNFVALNVQRICTSMGEIPVPKEGLALVNRYGRDHWELVKA